jgi:hypothetical protein
MPDFNVRSDSVNVEQIMEQIQARIREKRGVDYTEEQIRELAAVKLEKFLDPRGVRSDLLQQFRRAQPAPQPPNLPLYAFEDSTMFESHRGAIRFFRALFKPLLKLFFNPNVVAHVLHAQADINRQLADRVQTLEATARQQGELYYELLHNLVVEVTRLGIETKNLKMRVESLQSRLEFNERRARALESVVVYKPSEERRESERREPPRQRPAERETPPPPPSGAQAAPAATAPSGATGEAGAGQSAEGPGQRSRRRRRRRGRRGGAPSAAIMGGEAAAGQPHAEPGDLDEEGPETATDEEAAREAGETHAATAERIEQAFADDAQRMETHTNGAPEPGGGPGLDDQ